MFTGLVEGQGSVIAVAKESAGIRIQIAPPEHLWGDANQRVNPGDSIALNGCCLTVVSLSDGHWSFQAGEETLSKTNLGRLSPGDQVNLERAMSAAARFGGHFVQGHVDGTAEVASIRREAEWVDMTFSLPCELGEQLVPKGSVTVDGVSLTVVLASRDRFSVALIPHTLEVTTLGRLREGDRVHIETDVLGKYVRQYLLNLQAHSSLPVAASFPKTGGQ